MKYLTAAVFALIAAPALAQSTSVNVPTGYQVQGCTYYRLVDGAVKPGCITTDKATPDEIVRALVTPSDPRNSGSGGSVQTSD